MIKKQLDEYLEFDSDLLFKETDYLEIYGGAVRDSIACLEIHDIDILCMKESAITASNVLISNGYTNVTNKISSKDIQQMYKDIHCIFEPWTFMNKNLKIVQLIRPSIDNNFNNFNMNSHIIGFYNTMKEVDISCCGVSWNGKEIKENYTNAIRHCKGRIYRINDGAKMYNKKRIFERKYKLEQRGWKCIDNMTDDEYNFKMREQKVKTLL